MTAIIDNEDEFLSERLNLLLPHSSNFDACVGYFNLRGWRQIRPSVLQLNGEHVGESRVRILVGMAMRDDERVRRMYGIAPSDDRIDGPKAADRKNIAVKEFVDQLQFGIPTTSDLKGLQELREDLSSGLVRVSFAARTPLHAKLYLARSNHANQWVSAVVGSSNLTSAGLAKQGELNLEETDQQVAGKLHEWFEEKWTDQFTIDVTQDLIEAIDDSWAGKQPDPRLIHLKMAYELSRDARAGLTMDIPLKFRDILLDYQKPAVTIAARILEKQGLVVIGDVVGLGKTMVGTAIAATTGTKVLVVCPKSLEAMWNKYLLDYDVPGRVIPLSMVTRELPNLQRFPTIIVDESHNLRNANTLAATALRDYISENGSNVILLTATMFNARHMDLGNQLGLKIGADEDLGMRPEAFIVKELGNDLKIAKITGGPLSTLRAFAVSEENADWQNLLSKFLIRRTRGYIEKNYGTLNKTTERVEFVGPSGEMVSFPRRVTLPIQYLGGELDPGDRLARKATFDAIDGLKLARYSLGRYLVKEPQVTSDNADLVADLENSINTASGFIRTTLYKRLASSALAFLSTLERTLLRTHLYIHAVENSLPIPVGELKESTYDTDESADQTEELAQEGEGSITDVTHRYRSWAQGLDSEGWSLKSSALYDAIAINPAKKVRWAQPEWFDQEKLLEELTHDAETLQSIIDEHGEWDPDDDNRLKALAEQINGSPTGTKLLIFSEYRDTAEYVGKNLARLCDNRVVEVASGKSADPTKLARRFSPVSNQDLGTPLTNEPEIDILVATDVLSEGQNLQDCAEVVNWDLPWTIIRIVQRAGRVDRIGQKSDTIKVYSFMPHTGVNDIIQLLERLRERLKNAGEILGGKESFFDHEDADAMNKSVENLFDGSELKVDEGDVDYATYALGIWEGATEDEWAKVLKMSDVCSSTADVSFVAEDSVIAYSRTVGGYDFVAVRTETNGVKAISPLEGLKTSEKAALLPGAEPLDEHHEKVREIVGAQYERISARSALLHNDGLRARFNKFLNKAAQTANLKTDTSTYLNRLIDDFSHHPFLEGAKSSVLTLVRESERGEPIEALIGLAINLNHDGQLLNKLDAKDDDIRIVCSLGLRAGIKRNG
jgi:superfamily II DNA or RNA helicase